MDEAVPGRDRDSLRGIAGTELLQDVLHSRLHGLFRTEGAIVYKTSPEQIGFYD